jgi:phage gpG-like protein
MGIDEFNLQFERKMQDLRDFVRNDVPEIVGIEAVNHFKETFDKETDLSGNPWKEVERRDPESEWYGFSAGAKKNFSQARTTAKILSGETGELKEATTWRYEHGMVVVSNDKPYAAVHNFGQQAMIFGKKTFTMPKRQFMAHSKELQEKIDNKIEREMINIIK